MRGFELETKRERSCCYCRRIELLTSPQGDEALVRCDEVGVVRAESDEFFAEGRDLTLEVPEAMCAYDFRK
jgi:hypothetical protein